MRPENRLERLCRQVGNSGPMLRGTLIERRLPCGKGNCHCKKGGGHTGLYLTYSLESKTKTLYIPKKIEKKVREWSDNYKRFKKTLDQMFQFQLQIIRQCYRSSKNGPLR